MRTIISCGILFVNYLTCSAQVQVKLVEYEYIRFSYTQTCNKSFINKAMVFRKGNDSITINQKLPFNFDKKEIFDNGIFYSCNIEVGNTYTLNLIQIAQDSIPIEYTSYYRINSIFPNKGRRSEFIEISKDSAFDYKGRYDKYFDIKNTLYKMTVLSPATNCKFDH